MDNDNIEIVSDYSDKKIKYDQFSKELESLVISLLNSEKTRYHLIECRSKSIESLDEKTKRVGKSYRTLEEVPDLVGLRVIVFYQDDVYKIKEILEREFQVNEIENSHSSIGYSPDQFGYLSLHMLISLNEYRSQLREWEHFSGLSAEIQIRTVLQHSWAEISHKLHYKKEDTLPDDIRRRLFRLAGLFEIADEEFTALRDSRLNLENEIVENLKNDDLESIPVDVVSINKFVEKWEKMPKIEILMKEIGYKFDCKDRGFASIVGSLCHHLEISTLGELKRNLDFDPTEYLRSIFKPGWSVTNVFVVYLLLIRSNIEYFSVSSLIEENWSKESAKIIWEGAMRDRGLDF